MEYGLYGELIKVYPKPYSIYLRGTIAVGFRACFSERTALLEAFVSVYTGLRLGGTFNETHWIQHP